MTRRIMFPGMGADDRLFEPQQAAGLHFEVPAMPIPRRTDRLSDYAARLADQLKLDRDCVVLGVSFGGMVAAELGRLLNPRGVIQIASCRSRAAIPRYYWPVRWASFVLPDAVIRYRVGASSRIMARLESLSPEQYALVRRMSVSIPIPYLRQVGRMILTWGGIPSLACPCFHIHGGRDRIIPASGVQPTEVVPQGGHLINLTHADQVNRFLERSLAACLSDSPGGFSQPFSAAG